jgi:hypothetical protein
VRAKRTCEIIRARSFSAQPETTWREAVSDKTAALDARMKGADERLASVQKAMEVNKEAIDKAVVPRRRASKTPWAASRRTWRRPWAASKWRWVA